MVCASAASSTPGTASVEQRLGTLVDTERKAAGLPAREHRARVASAYDELFGDEAPRGLKTSGTAELHMRFEAANIAAFYTLGATYVRDMRVVLDELAGRDEAMPRELGDMHGAYVASRRFDEARQLASTHGLEDVERIPRISDGTRAFPGGATALFLSQTSDGLARRPVELDAYTGIVVIAHPLCGFSRDAVAAIEQAPVLEALFRRHSIWVAPVDRRLHLETLREWNRQHPVARHAIAHARDEWPVITDWSTPTFYFLKDGKAVGRVTGWPSGGQRRALIEEAQRIGLDAPPVRAPADPLE